MTPAAADVAAEPRPAAPTNAAQPLTTWRSETANSAQALAAVMAMQEACERADGGNAVMVCLSLCARYGLQMPDWLRSAFLQRYLAVSDAWCCSWDEAFGRPWPKGTRAAQIRQDQALMQRVHQAVWDLVRQDPSRSITRITFDTVGELPGIHKSGATTERLYYRALAAGAPNVAAWRAAMKARGGTCAP